MRSKHGDDPPRCKVKWPWAHSWPWGRARLPACQPARHRQSHSLIPGYTALGGDGRSGITDHVLLSTPVPGARKRSHMSDYGDGKAWGSRPMVRRIRPVGFYPVAAAAESLRAWGGGTLGLRRERAIRLGKKKKQQKQRATPPLQPAALAAVAVSVGARLARTADDGALRRRPKSTARWEWC